MCLQYEITVINCFQKKCQQSYKLRVVHIFYAVNVYKKKTVFNDISYLQTLRERITNHSNNLVLFTPLSLIIYIF